MKNFYKILALILLPTILILYANSAGSPGGKSGSQGDSNVTCTDCHTGTATPITGWITTNIPTGGYTPGTTYLITATGTHAGVVKFGFELTAETSTGSKIGTLAITEASRTKLCNQNKAVTHRSGGTAPTGNSNTWTMNWTAPATDVGQIRFYGAFNAANGNGNNSGDVIYTSTKFVNAVQPAVLLSVSPNHADQGAQVVVSVMGQNTNWGSQTPIIKLRNTQNNAYTITATQVVVVTNTELQATFDLPTDATLGMYDLMADAVVLPSCFMITILNAVVENSQSDYLLYPNPATDKIQIETSSSAVFSLFDLTGKLLIKSSIEAGNNTIDISKFQKGIYVSVIENGDSKSVKKLIIR